MKEFIKRVLSFFGSNVKVKALNKENSGEITGNGNELIQANHDIINNNIYMISVPEFNCAALKHNLQFKQEIEAMLKDVQKVDNGVDLKALLSNANNFRLVLSASSQLVTFPGDIERRELLRNLILEKFKKDEDDGGLYLEAITVMEKLRSKDFRVLAAMSFVMVLSRSLLEESIVFHKKDILVLLEEIGELNESDLEKLRVCGLVLPLFPKVFDIAGLDRLLKVDAQVYECCVQWLERSELVKTIKPTPLGALLAKNVFSVIYNLNYECLSNDKLPLKNADLNVGDINADGNVIAGGTMAFGKLS